MQLILLDNNLKAIKMIDDYISAIWTERYNECGDFELRLLESEDIYDTFKDDYYIYNADSEYLMVIENIDVTTDIEEGTDIVISGRSIESFIDRRIVWTQTVFQNITVHRAVKALLDMNAINPSDSSRVIPRLTFEDNPVLAESTDKIYAQFTGDNLYDAVKSLCDVKDYGFKAILNDQDQFVFSLYEGVDRTRDQNTVPFVEFSPEFDNIVNSRYLESKKTLKTVTLVAGEGEGAARKVTTVSLSSGTSGLDRRELFTDARDISSNVDGGTLSDADYLALLVQRGKEKLAENVATKIFDCETIKDGNFIYGRDYGLGDIVQYRNDAGIEVHARVTEFIRSHDASGEDAYPTFVVIDE